jgi:hypothetical protein
MQSTVNLWRPIAFFIGAGLTALTCFGLYEYMLKLEGGAITYMVVAAPVIAATAALLPPLAENQWKQGAFAKAVLAWVSFGAVVVLVFYSNAERVHAGKAGSAAEIGAKALAAQRAESELKDARDALPSLVKAEGDAKARDPKCEGATCRRAVNASTSGRNRVEKAEQAVLAAQSRAVQASPLQAPAWLMPLVLDLVAFLGVWVGLSGPWVTTVTKAERPKQQQRKRSRAPSKRKTSPKLVPANANNVVPMSPAG